MKPWKTFFLEFLVIILPLQVVFSLSYRLLTGEALPLWACIVVGVLFGIFWGEIVAFVKRIVRWK